MGIPKYKLVYNEILRLILSNEWPVNSFMKSEKQLIEFFNVSRLTVRNVLSKLQNEGRIKKSRGKKTIILDRRLDSNVHSELKDRSIDLNLNYNLINFKLISNHLKNKFTSSDALYFVERTRGVSKDRIYLISRAYMSKEFSGTIIKADVIKHKNLLDLLMFVSNLTFKSSLQELKAINLNAVDAKFFKTFDTVPAISNTWHFYDNRNNLVLIDEEIIIEPIRVQHNYD